MRAKKSGRDDRLCVESKMRSNHHASGLEPLAKVPTIVETSFMVRLLQVRALIKSLPTNVTRKNKNVTLWCLFLYYSPKITIETRVNFQDYGPSDSVLECVCKIGSIDLLLISTHSQLQKSTYDIKCLSKNVRSMNFDDISKHILLKCNTVYSLSAL